MDELDSIAEARAEYGLQLALESNKQIHFLEAMCLNHRATLYEHIEKLCEAHVHQARAQAGDLLTQYEAEPLAESVAAEKATADQVQARIEEVVVTYTDALERVAKQLAWHPSVVDLQRLLDLSPPPREPLTPAEPQPGETLHQSSERLLLDKYRENYAELTYLAREDAREDCDSIRDHLMTRTLLEFDELADEILRQHHEAAPASAEFEQQRLDGARAALDEKLRECRSRLAFIITELAVWEDQVGLYALVRFGAAIRAADEDADAVTVVKAVFDELRERRPA